MYFSHTVNEILEEKEEFTLYSYRNSQNVSDYNLHGYRYKLNLFPVPKSYFPRIEYALEIKLTDQQKKKLNYPEYEMFGGRRIGRTLTHCILLALSIGEPLKIEVASDYGNGTLEYKNVHFAIMYRDIVEKLGSVGFNTREVYYNDNGKRIRIGGWKVN